MSKYFERRITYDPDTQLYTVSVPELEISVTSDTEVSGIVEIRKEVQEAAKRPRASAAAQLDLDEHMYATQPPIDLPKPRGWYTRTNGDIYYGLPE